MDEIIIVHVVVVVVTLFRRGAGHCRRRRRRRPRRGHCAITTHQRPVAAHVPAERLAGGEHLAAHVAPVHYRRRGAAGAELAGARAEEEVKASARTRGRLWLVRWPPRAWNVENRRPHVRHWNAPPSRCTRFTPPPPLAITLLAGDSVSTSISFTGDRVAVLVATSIVGKLMSLKLNYIY